MEQKKNVIQALGDFIEAKGGSWIFPDKEESLPESGINTLSLIFFIPFFGILLVIRCLFLLFKLFFSFFNTFISHNSSNKTTTTNRNNEKIVTCSILIVLIILISPRILYHYAKKQNVKLIERQELYYFPSFIIEYYIPEDYILSKTFIGIEEALNNAYANREVIKLRKQLNIDDDFAKGLHFSSTDDFMLYLYSIKEIDTGVKPYINEADSICHFKNMSNHFQIATFEDYEKGNFYSASAEMKHYFKIYYCHQDDYPFTEDINKMHLMKLLLQHPWELSTNRDFAKAALSCVNSIENNDSYKYSDYGKLKKLSNEVPILNNISTYFEGLYNFYHSNRISALHCFESCYESTTDTTLKQYCALMSIRTAFWNYDKLRNDQALNIYRKVYKKYSSAITLRYFKPDVQKYQSVVLEIINNPDYTGYENTDHKNTDYDYDDN